jgi:hypothetical protein
VLGGLLFINNAFIHIFILWLLLLLVWYHLSPCLALFGTLLLTLLHQEAISDYLTLIGCCLLLPVGLSVLRYLLLQGRLLADLLTQLAASRRREFILIEVNIALFRYKGGPALVGGAFILCGRATCLCALSCDTCY